MVLKYRVQDVCVPSKVLRVLRPQVGGREQQAAILRKDLVQLPVCSALYVVYM